MKRVIPIILALILLLSIPAGCSGSGSGRGGDTDTGDGKTGADIAGNDGGAAVAAADAVFSGTETDMFTSRDYEIDYAESESITIRLEGGTATASSESVRISGSTITITEEKTHIISGTLDDGMIIVDAGGAAKLQLVLNGASINSEASAALYIVSADKVFVTLAEGTENTLSNGGAFEAIDESNIDGAVFSRQDLTFNGLGSLEVISPAGHGIVCKDDLVFTGGKYIIASAFHGLDANDSVRIANAELTIDAGKDGIHAENNDDESLGFIYIASGNLDIEAEGDGIDAGAYLQLENGELKLLAGGGSVNGSKVSSDFYGGFMGGGRPGSGRPPSENGDESDGTSMKGLKASSGILISDGSIAIDSADDAIHSNASIIINGGRLELASGDDAIHADDTITITACGMNVSESYEGIEAEKLYVKGGDIIINAADDGLNASGGMDSSGVSGGRDGMLGGRFGGGMPASNGSIEISGGNITIYASGDGLDSNGTLTISGGYIYIANPTAGDSSVLDSDSSPIITGGIFISTGSTTMMAQSFDTASTQGVIACTTGTQPAGSTVTVRDAGDNVILSYETEYTCVLVIISSPDIVKGNTYTLAIGSVSGEIEAR